MSQIKNILKSPISGLEKEVRVIQSTDLHELILCSKLSAATFLMKLGELFVIHSIVLMNSPFQKENQVVEDFVKDKINLGIIKIVSEKAEFCIIIEKINELSKYIDECVRGDELIIIVEHEVDVSIDVNDTYELFSEAGKWDKEITPEVMRELGLAHRHNDKDFHPLTALEESFMMEGDGFPIGKNGFAKTVRCVLLDGKKFLQISDNDYVEASPDEIDFERMYNFRANLADALNTYSEISSEFGVAMHHSINPDLEYNFDIYLPMDFFGIIDSQKKFLHYFENKLYMNCPKARSIKLINEAKRFNENRRRGEFQQNQF